MEVAPEKGVRRRAIEPLQVGVGADPAGRLLEPVAQGQPREPLGELEREPDRVLDHRAADPVVGRVTGQSWSEYSGSARFRSHVSRSIRFLTIPGFSRTRRSGNRQEPNTSRTFRDKNRNTLVKGDLVGITQA